MIAAFSAHIAALLIVVTAVLMAAAPLGYRLGLSSATGALTKLVPAGLVAGALAALLALMIFVTFNDLASFGLWSRLGGLIG